MHFGGGRVYYSVRKENDMHDRKQLEQLTTRELQAYLNILKFRMRGVLVADDNDHRKNNLHLTIVTEILQDRKVSL